MLLLSLIASCDRFAATRAQRVNVNWRSTTDASSSATVDARGAAPTQDARAHRCLPVVADECGCVYPCAEGTLERDSRYHVRAAISDEALPATVSNWCVNGQCTLAFHVPLPCDGICAPRPADSTCAFQNGRCLTARASTVVDGAYQVRWQRGGAVAGVLSLQNGTYHWVGRPPARGQRTFAFVEHPTGRYTVETRAAQESADATVAVVDFAQENTAISESERRVEVRVDAQRAVRFFHSVVSELELWQIESLPGTTVP